MSLPGQEILSLPRLASCATPAHFGFCPEPTAPNPEPSYFFRSQWRRRPESNRCIEVLQTSALPLGYVATIIAGGLARDAERSRGTDLRLPLSAAAGNKNAASTSKREKHRARHAATRGRRVKIRRRSGSRPGRRPEGYSPHPGGCRPYPPRSARSSGWPGRARRGTRNRRRRVLPAPG